MQGAKYAGLYGIQTLVILMTGREKEAARGIKGGNMKPSDVQGGSVCIICGKPSKQRICDSCRAKVEAEAINYKLKAVKPDKQPD